MRIEQPPGLTMRDLVRLLAAWALVHESADEGWRAAVERGRRHTPGEPGPGDPGASPAAFVDGLAALVADEVQRLKGELGGEAGESGASTDVVAALDALRFEVAELRGRIETLQVSVDASASRGPD
jgi:hypothetical protein